MLNRRRSHRLANVVFALLAGAGMLAVGLPERAVGQSPAQQKVRLDMPAQDLSASLTQFGRETGTEIVFAPDAVREKKAAAIKGEFERGQALKKLLDGSGLTYRVTAQGAIVVEAAKAVADATAMNLSPAGAALAEGGSSAQQQSASTEEPRSSEGSSAVTLEEVVVTGTHIRGSAPISSNLTVLSREDIDKSGFATVQDLLKIVPQNFGATRAETDGGIGNFGKGTGVNLRGLGTGATLTLVNGRRQPASGDGDFVDVDSIPAAAIERIEILSDGASALYGSDAIGGVVNIILRKSYEGAETRARFATAGGDSDETVVSQVLGGSLGGWNAMVGYQFYERTPLRRADRDFAASSDKTSMGGTDFRTASSNPGNIWDPNTFVLRGIPAGQDGTALTPDQLLDTVNLGDPAAGLDLLGRNQTQAGFFSVSRQFTDRWSVFADGRIGTRKLFARDAASTGPIFVPPSNPFYVDLGPDGLLVEYNFFNEFGNETSRANTRTWTATLGSDLDLANQWRISAYASYGTEKLSWRGTSYDFFAIDTFLADPDPATAFNPFGEGANTNPQTIASLHATQVQGAKSELLAFNLLADGKLWQLPSGVMRLAVGADYRQEDLSNFRQFLGFLDDVDSVLDTQFSDGRNVSAAFVELTIPIANRRSSTDESPLLQASLAGRYEHYSDFGNTFNPKIGLELRPFSNLALRASWGSSFRAPRLIDTNQIPGSAIIPAIDPLLGGQFTNVLARSSGADLQEETAESWTLGLTWQGSALVPGLLASLTYYDIDYTDRIITPGPLDATQILLEEAQWQELINRSPTAEELAPLCAEAAQSGYDCSATPPTAIVDLRLRNIAALRTQGFDMSLQQQLETRIGQLTLGLSANYVLNHELQLTSTSQPIDQLDTAGNPNDLKLRATGAWSKGPLSIDAAVNYADSYRSSVPSNSRAIDSFTTVDLGAAYRVTEDSGWLSGMNFAVRAVNIFDTAPPFYDTPFGFDTSNASPLGRLVSAQITKAW